MLRKFAYRPRFIAWLALVCAGAWGASAADYAGIVVSKTGGTPVEGALVSVGHSEFYTRTDKDGRFAITNPTTAVAERSVYKAEPQRARWNFRGRTLDLNSAPGVSSASIYTINGKRVFNRRIPTSRIVGLPKLAMGTYLLELRGEQGALYRTHIVLSNQAASSFAFGAAPTGGDSPRSAKSAKALAASERLIFRHDDYIPRDSAMAGSNTDMRVVLEPDVRSLVFDQSKVREYRFTISREDSITLDTKGYEEKYVPADMQFDGIPQGRVGIRYKGSGYTLPRCFGYGTPGGLGSTPKTCAKISFKIKFSEYDKDKRFYNMKKLNLHAMSADGTKMHDMLAYGLFRDMGIYAPRTSYANVYVNNKLVGLFAAVEDIDGRFTKSRWPIYGDGNLYKEVWPDSNSANYYIAGLKTNNDDGDTPNAQQMLSYYNAIQASNEQNFAQNLSPYMDFDYFLRYMAADVAIHNWDGFRSWYSDNQAGRNAHNHNYYFYEEENSGGKIWLIPWDMDQTFGDPDNYFENSRVPQWNVTPQNCNGVSVGGGNYLRPPNCDKLTKLMASVFWSRYVELGDKFLNDQFVSQRLVAKIDAHSALISESVNRDPAITQSTWNRDVNGFKNALSSLATKFRTHIGK